MKEDEIRQLLLSAEDLMSQCPDDSVTDLRSRFQTLSKQLIDVRAKADKHKVVSRLLYYAVINNLYSLELNQ